MEKVTSYISGTNHAKGERYVCLLKMRELGQQTGVLSPGSTQFYHSDLAMAVFKFRCIPQWNKLLITDDK